MEDKQSFIAEARREQIIKSCVDALDEYGYTNVSLTKVAEKAKVSTGLISYHFSGKMDLINQTLLYLLNKKLDFISEKVAREETLTAKLNTYIEASLAYQVANYKNNIALIEIIFNAKDENQVPYYKAEDNDEDPLHELLKVIILDGQKNGEFSNTFDAEITCVLIQGAIEESMLKHNESFDFEAYKTNLIGMITKILRV